MFPETIKLAMRAISRNLLRSFLTVLGVVIGVAAVIAMGTVGNGTTAQVKSELSRLGTNMLFVRPGQFGPGRASTEAKRFNDNDVQAMRDQISGLRAVAPVNRSTATAIFGGKNHSSSALGTTNDYLIAQDWPLSLGRDFSPAEDQDDTILMPLKIHQRRIGGTSTISSIMVSAQDGVQTSKVQSDLESLLRERRRIVIGREDDFSVNDMTQIASAMTGTTTLLTGLLGSVAAVSLLVGGIGIMNIMLVSVTERTREIGIRLAIGALETQVLRQFLVEAVMLSAFGGIVGILTGLGLAYAVVSFLNVPFVASPSIIFLAFAFSAAIGVVFGYFPARRAASLSPIEALRHE